MAHKILFSPEAQNDMKQIREYISIDLDNKTAAARTVGKITKSISVLKDMPEVGTPLSSRVDVECDYRYLVSGNYNVFYRLEDENVKIIRILNARRNFMAILFGKDF